MDKAAEVLIELSDIANCISGDFHTMHLNVVGIDFDTMHAKVLKEYYEAAADDYDSIAEMVRRKPWRIGIPSANVSAERISWQNYQGECDTSRDNVIRETDSRLGLYLEQMNIAYKFFDANGDCPISQGIASWLQDRLNFWGAEWGFFNAGRLS